MNKLKIGPRLMLFVASILLVSWSGMLIWTYVEFKQNTANQARDFAGNVHTMTLAGLTGMMITGTIGQRAVFLDQIRSSGEIPELNVLRGDSVTKQFGIGTVERQPDAIEETVLRTGEPYYQVESNNILRAVLPAKASKDFLGKNCLTCHMVSEGAVLGAVSMRVSLQKAEDSLNLFTLKAVITAAILVALTLAFVLVYIRRIVSQPLANACSLLHEIADGNITQTIVVDRDDETGDLLRSMQSMQASLKRLVSDVHGLVEAGARGNFEERIDETSQKGFGRDLCQELNRLSLMTQSSLADIVSVAQALAQGDLGRRVDKDYPGVFGEASRGMNATVDALKMVIEEIRDVVNEAANGEFEIRIDESSKQGYVRTLADLLNRLTSTTREALTDIVSVADQVSGGNLMSVMAKSHPGLFGEASKALDTTVERLRSLMEQVVAMVGIVLIAAKEIAEGNGYLTQRMKDQEVGLTEASGSMSRVAGTLRSNASCTMKASELAKESTGVAEQGNVVVRQTVETMEVISASSRRINEIIGVIDGIAFQTNILALNAAVEAARAGEQGRGFAVVASEVRSLAQRSAQAAQEIKVLIGESVSKVESGTQQVNLAGATMSRIVESIYQMNELIVDISRITTEQSDGVAEASQSVVRVDEMNQQNTILVDRAAASAESLAYQAQALQSLMETFRLR